MKISEGGQQLVGCVYVCVCTCVRVCMCACVHVFMCEDLPSQDIVQAVVHIYEYNHHFYPFSFQRQWVNNNENIDKKNWNNLTIANWHCSMPSQNLTNTSQRFRHLFPMIAINLHE